MKYKDTLIASGIYRIEPQKDPYESLLYFGPSNRYTYRFSSDTLVITYSGGFVLNISKYVRM